MSYSEEKSNSNKRNLKTTEEIHNLEIESELLNREIIIYKLKEYRESVKKADQKNISILSKYFKEIYKCLGDKEKKELEKEITSINNAISKGNISDLDLAKLRNYKAKLSVIDYKTRIKEAADGQMRNTILNNDERKMRKRVLIGGAGALAAVIAVAGLCHSCNKNKIKNSSNMTTTNSINSLSDSTSTNNSDKVDLTRTSDNTKNTTGLSLETVDLDGYTSPSSDLGDDTQVNASDKYANPTVESLRPLTDSTAVSVIYEPDIESTIETGSYETRTIPTDVNGTQPNHTEPEVQPSGSDSLPEEPTRVTVNLDTEETTTQTTQTESTTQYTESTTQATESTTKATEANPTPVPVETVDPNDPNNVIGAKVLILTPFGFR